MGTTTRTTDVIGSAEIELWGGARTAFGARLLERVEGRSSQAHWFRNSSYTQKGNLLLLRQRQVSLLVGHSLNMRQVPGSSPNGRKGAVRANDVNHLDLTFNGYGYHDTYD